MCQDIALTVHVLSTFKTKDLFVANKLRDWVLLKGVTFD